MISYGSWLQLHSVNLLAERADSTWNRNIWLWCFLPQRWGLEQKHCVCYNTAIKEHHTWKRRKKSPLVGKHVDEKWSRTSSCEEQNRTWRQRHWDPQTPQRERCFCPRRPETGPQVRPDPRFTVETQQEQNLGRTLSEQQTHTFDPSTGSGDRNFQLLMSFINRQESIFWVIMKQKMIILSHFMRLNTRNQLLFDSKLNLFGFQTVGQTKTRH